MGATTYLNPQGVPIAIDAWRGQDISAYTISRFANERIEVHLTTASSVHNASDIPRSMWKMYELKVWNIVSTDSDGMPLTTPKRINDPEASKGYRTIELAKKAYEGFIAQYSDSHFDNKTGELVEVGNTLLPPNPDIPEVPTTEEACADAGSW